MSALEALERNDISRLPGGIFSRAFVRSYAIEVGLDPEATIQEFIAQFPHDSVTAGHPTSSAGRRPPGDRERSADGDDVRAADRAERADCRRGAVLRDRGARRRAPGAARDVDDARAEAAPCRRRRGRRRAAAPARAAVRRRLRRRPPAPRRRTAPADVRGRSADRRAVGQAARAGCRPPSTASRRSSACCSPASRQTIEVRREIVLTAGDASALTLTLNGAEARPLGRPGEVVTARLNLDQFQRLRADPVSGPTPLLDFFKRGEVARDVRLLAAQGTLAPRAHEQLAILVLLLEDRRSPRSAPIADETLEPDSGRGAEGVPRAVGRADRPARVLRRSRHLSRRDAADRSRGRCRRAADRHRRRSDDARRGRSEDERESGDAEQLATMNFPAAAEGGGQGHRARCARS